MTASPTTALVTVGSTSFAALIASCLSPRTLAALHALGIRTLLVQFGSSPLPPGWSLSPLADTTTTTATTLVVERDGLRVELFAYKDAIEHVYDLPSVALVVSHAGAGSILTALRANKPLVAVVNRALADDHQRELACALGQRGHLVVASSPETLPDTLASLSLVDPLAGLYPFPPPKPRPFLALLDAEAGFLDP